jgi:GNAT superfamily N-acetyltransferase
MLHPAVPSHLPHLRTLIREGAAEGAFEDELAANSIESALFFANLRQALATGRFLVEDARGVLSSRAVAGYVYWPDDHDAQHEPVGFGLFRALDAFGFEFWLTAVGRRWRGNGYGRALLRSLLETPAGRLAFVVRVRIESAGRSAMEHLLSEHGFVALRECGATRWFVRADAPEDLRGAIATAPSRSVH